MHILGLTPAHISSVRLDILLCPLVRFRHPIALNADTGIVNNYNESVHRKEQVETIIYTIQ